MQGDKSARVLRTARDNLVALPPVEGENAQVHAVGGVLSEGYNLGVGGVHEPGGGLASASVHLALVGIEVGALEIGGAAAQIVHLAHGFYRLVGGRAAAAR